MIAVPVGCAVSYVGNLYLVKPIFITINVLYFTFYFVVPMVVLVINMLLIREMRRAYRNAANNLGLQHHHQHQSQSAVPTVMLVSTSLVYVVLRGSVSTVHLINDFIVSNNRVLRACMSVFGGLSRFVFTYNFFVYVITGKQFRSDLCALFSRCSSSSSSVVAAAAAAQNRNNIRLADRRQTDTAL